MANDPSGARRSSGLGSEAFSSAAKTASQATSKVADAAQRATSEAGERLTITMEDQKRAGAERLAQFAKAALTAANQLTKDSPEVAGYIRGAAEQAQGFSE